MAKKVVTSAGKLKAGGATFTCSSKSGEKESDGDADREVADAAKIINLGGIVSSIVNSEDWVLQTEICF